jgi:hypothetical protein
MSFDPRTSPFPILAASLVVPEPPESDIDQARVCLEFEQRIRVQVKRIIGGNRKKRTQV